MSYEGDPTRQTYEDPTVVEGYIRENADNLKLAKTAREFAQSLPGRRLVDIGCGPGQYAHFFAQLGLDVTALDYSNRMIESAKILQQENNPPKFMVADMRDIGILFDEDSFDGAWLSASLLHIDEVDTPKVMKGVRRITVNMGKVYVGLKGGDQGSQLITEDKYKLGIQRRFTFWEKDRFQKVIDELGFKVTNYTEDISGLTGGKPTAWLNFFLEVSK